MFHTKRVEPYFTCHPLFHMKHTFLKWYNTTMFAKVYSAQTSAGVAKLIDLEINYEKGVPDLRVVGLPDKAVEEAKDRVSSAISNAEFKKQEDFKTLKSAFAKITISLAPADIRKTGTLFDLPIALAYLVATGEIDKKSAENAIFVGELGLDGSLRPIKGALSIAKLAKENNIHKVYLPKENAKEAALIKGVEIYGLDNLAELVLFLRGEASLIPQKHTKIKDFKVKLPKILLDDIKGQDLAKRALKIAAAGGHNIAFFGPPGTGKSMLAKVFTSLLPDLSEEDVLEVTGIHSIAGVSRGTIVTRPPFRAPHHSSSYVSIVGGGAKIMPGEITLAHKGVLFLDEFPEFDKRVVNALREPLEEKQIIVSRATGSEVYPADFMLIVALNPCPCGYFGTNKCTCTASAIQKYQNKISGPIVDRIDIWVEVNQIEYEKLLENTKREAKEHNLARKEIKKARETQKKRFTRNILNAGMSAPAINKFINLTDELKGILNSAAQRMGLSARAYHKVLKVARTIADMEGEKDIKETHILEALSYREKVNG